MSQLMIDGKEKVEAHEFKLNTLKSSLKGSMKKKGTIWRIADVDNLYYECLKCQSAFETNEKFAGAKSLKEMNKEITLRFACI